jgi:hypothetical protein
MLANVQQQNVVPAHESKASAQVPLLLAAMHSSLPPACTVKFYRRIGQPNATGMPARLLTADKRRQRNADYRQPFGQLKQFNRSTVSFD